MTIDHWFAMEALFCEEDEEWIKETNPHPHLLEFFQQDLPLEDEELNELLFKERTDLTLSQIMSNNQDDHPDLSLARHIAVRWMMRVGFHYRFSSSTTILAVNYLDRVFCSVKYQIEKPWMTQLVAVACLSLAAKMEETHVPLLLDFQLEDAQYMFEARTIKRMELLVLSTLQWKMNPITPVSFLDYLVRKLDLKSPKSFFRECHSLLQSIASDYRYIGYLPSVLAAASITCLAEEMDPCITPDPLMSALKISEDELDGCCKFMGDFLGGTPRKRRRLESCAPKSPNGVAEACFSGNTSNSFWAMDSGSSDSSSHCPLSLCQSMR